MILDIDRFKSINDTYGHQNGDRVISAISQELRDNLRGADMVSRFGGEEFLISMPDTSVEEATIAANRLRRKVEGLRVGLFEGGYVKATISVGLTVRTPKKGSARKNLQDMIRDADAALYSAKSAGRNQVNRINAAA